MALTDRCRNPVNGHVGSDRIGYEEVHGGHGVGAPNEDGI